MLNINTKNLRWTVSLGDLNSDTLNDIAVEKDGTITIHLTKTAKNETEAERIRRHVKLAGGGFTKKSFYNCYLEDVENSEEAEGYSQYCKIENDQTRVFIQLQCKV